MLISFVLNCFALGLKLQSLSCSPESVILYIQKTSLQNQFLEDCNLSNWYISYETFTILETTCNLFPFTVDWMKNKKCSDIQNWCLSCSNTNLIECNV